MRTITDYIWHTGKLLQPVKLLVISDLHNDRYEDLLPLLPQADVLLLPGDLADAYRQQFDRAIAFLETAAEQLPTFVSMGNHDARLDDYYTYARQVQESGAAFLFNTYQRLGDLVIGGWYRPHLYGQEDCLPAMQAEEGCRILMSHRPEDYFQYLQNADIDLIVSGHTHGGQIRIGNRGLYSSGQGIFPRHTKGIVENMIISAGVSNRVAVPRWHNPCEIVRILLD